MKTKLKTELQLQRELKLRQAIKFFGIEVEPNPAAMLKNMVFAAWLDSHTGAGFRLEFGSALPDLPTDGASPPFN